jgi:hypothetical protein
MSERVGNDRVRRLFDRTDLTRPTAGHRLIDHMVILDFLSANGLHDAAQGMTAVMSGVDADLCGARIVQFS